MAALATVIGARTWPAVAGTALMLACVSMTLATVVLAIADRHFLPYWDFKLAGLSIEQTYALRVAESTVGAIVLAVVAGLVLWRQPRNAFSWAFATMAVGVASTSLMGQYAVHGLNVAPGSVPFAGDVARSAAVLASLVLIAALGAILLFPDGRLKSRRWWLAVALVVMVSLSGDLNDLGQPGGVALGMFSVRQFVPVTSPPEIWPLSAAWGRISGFQILDLDLQRWAEIALALVAILGVLLRLREARGETRLQLKWFTYAVALAALVFIPTRIAWTPVFGNIPRPIVGDVVVWSEFIAMGLGFGLLIPLAVGVAIFRYRLYAIDLVISRTIVYAGLAAFVTAIYALTAAGLGGLIGEQAGRDPLITVLAIGIVALLLEPVRSRLQRIANIAVYGRRANPYEVLSDFARSVSRAESADDLVPRMARLLRDGTSAASVQLWVKVGQRLQLAASEPPSEEGRGASDTRELASLGGPAATVVPVFQETELLGAFVVLMPRGEHLNAIESRLLEDLASQAGLVFSRFRLLQELRESRSRIVAAQDLERRRLERDLHDGAQQRFASALLALGMARDSKNGTTDPATLIEEASTQVRAGLSELRDLARGLHPPLLTESGLLAAVRALADRSPIMTSVHATAGRYRESVEVTAYFVIAEALANAAKHSRASNVDVKIEERDGRLRIEVRDDGVGGVELGRGSGLVGLQDRMSAIGGTLAVDSRPGAGTIVSAELPCV
jgi:signal transduction histidine kinase